MRFTPVDRIFCRIGASDCLAAGQSTFYIELNETNVILRNSTPHSLVVIDELGRGTSTYGKCFLTVSFRNQHRNTLDGMAIAQAVLRNLAEKVTCRTLFSTHYHSLCNTSKEHPSVKLGHMVSVFVNFESN
jgi:DNA mismatch repair protein MSH6